MMRRSITKLKIKISSFLGSFAAKTDGVSGAFYSLLSTVQHNIFRYPFYLNLESINIFLIPNKNNNEKMSLLTC